MRHRVHGRKLGRTSAHRKALFRNQLTALFTHERIITTVAKAKELRPIAERMVTLAGTGTLAARRRVATMVQDKDVARRLFEEIAPRFADRPGGYTRIMRLGRRHGDNAEIAIIEFIDYELADHQADGEKEAKGSFLDRAKGMFGGGVADQAAEAGDDAVETDEAAADEEVVAVTEPAVDDDVEVVETEAIEEPATEDVVEVEAAEAVEADVTEVAPSEEAPAAEAEAVSEETAEDEEKKSS